MDSRFHKLHQLTSNSHRLDPFDPPVMRFSETLTSTLATATALGSSASQSAPNGSLTVQPDASTISRTPSPTISMTNTRPDSSMLSQSGAAPSATPANQTFSADDKNHRALGDRILDLQDALQLLHDNFLSINAGGVDDKRHIRPNVTSLIATVKTKRHRIDQWRFCARPWRDLVVRYWTRCCRGNHERDERHHRLH